MDTPNRDRKYAFWLDDREGWCAGWVYVIAASQKAANRALTRRPGLRKCYYGHMPAEGSQHSCGDCCSSLPPYSIWTPEVIKVDPNGVRTITS